MMTEQWYSVRNDRSMRYAGRVLDPGRWLVVEADPSYAARYSGQVAILTAVNLLGRMTPSVALDVPDVVVTAPLPWAGMRLRDLLERELRDADPYCRLDEFQGRSDEDYVLHIGPGPAAHVVHGDGWDLFAGPGPSSVTAMGAHNPIGPALAAVLGVSQLFVRNLSAPLVPAYYSAWSWGSPVSGAPDLPGPLDLGRVWCVGTGSVGTAILYFLTLATRSFSTTLFDMDRVKIENLDRSPIFRAGDVGEPKVDAAARFLRDAGVVDVAAQACPLDESPLWLHRTAGTPDLLIAAANERNVRSVIEAGYPPVQVYGTTGKNWQAAVLRHVPLVDPCSCCIFPEQTGRSTSCAEAEVVRADEAIDAALPFLSFAAGAMAAAELLKLAAGWVGSAPNRAFVATNPEPRISSVPMSHRAGCPCASRSRPVYERVLGGSRYASLSVSG